MNGIRIDSGLKRIEVNESGDYITLALNDDNFIRKLYELIEKADKAGADIDKHTDILEQFDAVTAFDQQLMAGLDDLFGAGTCQKVFGDIHPNAVLFFDFFEQLTPYIDAHRQDQERRLGKYDAKRKGSAI